MNTCPDYVTSVWALYVREAAGSFTLCFFYIIVIIVIICHNLVSAVMPVGSSVLSVGSVEFPASSLVRDEMC